MQSISQSSLRQLTNWPLHESIKIITWINKEVNVDVVHITLGNNKTHNTHRYNKNLTARPLQDFSCFQYSDTSQVYNNNRWLSNITTSIMCLWSITWLCSPFCNAEAIAPTKLQNFMVISDLQSIAYIVHSGCFSVTSYSRSATRVRCVTALKNRLDCSNLYTDLYAAI